MIRVWRQGGRSGRRCSDEVQGGKGHRGTLGADRQSGAGQHTYPQANGLMGLPPTPSRPGGRRAGPAKMGKDITVLGLTLTSDK